VAVKALSLSEFLAASNLPDLLNLPWVHSTAAQNLFDILASQKILATPCTVFKGEELCYLFVGRPAYKTPSVPNPSSWQLPVAFVVRFKKPPPLKHIHPFDSGAFFHRRLPSYITNFKLDRFELASNSALMGRLVSLMFKTPARYMSREPVGDYEFKNDNSLDMRHQEILALAKLYRDNSSAEFDDRAAAIEIAIEEDIELTQENILGVVIPGEYARVPKLVKELKVFAPRVETYDLQPLSTASHFGNLYDCVANIYKKSGIKY
jgi:hypothetical protein